MYPVIDKKKRRLVGLVATPDSRWHGTKWSGSPAYVDDKDVNTQAVSQSWKHQISARVLIETLLLQLVHLSAPLLVTASKVTPCLTAVSQQIDNMSPPFQKILKPRFIELLPGAHLERNR